MKQPFSFLLVACICFLSCTGSKKKPDQPPVTVVPIEEVPDIVEVNGTIGDGTSMNMLELIKPDGDTVNTRSPARHQHHCPATPLVTASSRWP